VARAAHRLARFADDRRVGLFIFLPGSRNPRAELELCSNTRWPIDFFRCRFMESRWFCFWGLSCLANAEGSASSSDALIAQRLQAWVGIASRSSLAAIIYIHRVARAAVMTRARGAALRR